MESSSWLWRSSSVSSVNKDLKDKGRFVLRYSGTEPVAQIFVEGEDLNFIQDQAKKMQSFF